MQISINLNDRDRRPIPIHLIALNLQRENRLYHLGRFRPIEAVQGALTVSVFIAHIDVSVFEAGALFRILDTLQFSNQRRFARRIIA